MKKLPLLIILILSLTCWAAMAQPVKDGYGKETLPDGSVYEGWFKDGAFDGKGTINYADGRTYTGEFKYGLFDGKGTLTYLDGSQYKGGFVEGELDGQGVLTYADGSVYKGKFKDGDYDGAKQVNPVPDSNAPAPASSAQVVTKS